MKKLLVKKIVNWILQNKLLFLILIIAATLRFIGIYPGYPITHPDETYIYGHAIQMIKNLNIDPVRYDYPAFIPLLHAFIYMLFFNPLFILYSLFFAPDNLPVFKNLFFFYQHVPLYNQQTAVVFWGRTITAVFSLGIVYLVYRVGKSFFDHRVGLVAAFLTAVNFRQVLNSRIGLPDVYNAFFLLLSFYSIFNLLKKPNRKNYLLSGVVLTLFFMTKSQVFPILAFVIVHLILSWRKGLLKNIFRVEFILAMVMIPLVYFLVNIYQFIHWDKFINANHYTTLQYHFGVNNFDFYPISYLYHIGLGELILIFTILGFILGVMKYRLPSLLLLSTVLPFLYLFLYYSNGGFYTRNFITIIPILLIFAGLFIVEILLIIGKLLKFNPTMVNMLIVLVVLFISLGQIKNSFLNSSYFAKPWGSTKAQEWTLKNIPNGSTVAVRNFDKFPKKKQFKRINFEMTNAFSLAELQEEGADYGYIAVDDLSVYFYWWMRTSSNESIKYWNKEVPDSISQNMFPAKAAQELSSWAVAAFVKPWQAPDANFLIVKIPPKLELQNKKLIKNFTFDDKQSLSSWFLIKGEENNADNIIWDNGLLEIKQASVYPSVIRAVSEVIPLGHNNDKSHAYEISGQIKTGRVLDKKDRDGYLRVDFYEDNPGAINLKTKSYSTSLSSRVFGTSSWVEKKIAVVAPTKARFMTVSLDFYGVGATNIWFDDINIFQSEEYFLDPRVQKPYLNYYQIPKNIIFPVSHGNL